MQDPFRFKTEKKWGGGVKSISKEKKQEKKRLILVKIMMIFVRNCFMAVSRIIIILFRSNTYPPKTNCSKRIHLYKS